MQLLHLRTHLCGSEEEQQNVVDENNRFDQVLPQPLVGQEKEMYHEGWNNDQEWCKLWRVGDDTIKCIG